MVKDNRPLSPHLQVYRWQVTMFLSILHRLTGVALAGGAVLITWLLMAAVSGEAQFNTFHGFAGSFIGMFMIIGWIWAFAFHFLNGIRHLVWDTGRGFSISAASKSAWVVLALSFVCAVAIWYGAGGFSTEQPS